MGIAAGHGVLLELQGGIWVAQHALREHRREGSRVDVRAALRQQHGLAAQSLGQLQLRRQQGCLRLALQNNSLISF